MGKLWSLKQVLRHWNKEVFGNIDTKIVAGKDSLAAIQKDIYEMGDSESLMNSELEATVELNQCLAQQHAFFAQKNRNSWLRDGNRNTAFFHRIHRIRKARAGINTLNVDGVVTTDLKVISEHIVRFYSDLFRASNREPPDFALVHELISPVFNPAKTKAYFSKHVPLHIRRYAHTTLGISVGELPFTYLGVPLFRGVPKAVHLRGIADRILGKFATWKGTALSMVGRICLLNSVIASSLVHSMMVYKWPRSLLNNIDRAMRCFVWTGKIEAQGFCTVSWGKACASKNEGGLGIRSIITSNETFLQKLAWSVLTSQESAMTFVRSRFWKGLLARACITSSVGGGFGLTSLISRVRLIGFWVHLDEFFVTKHLDIVEQMMNYSCEADSDTLVWPRSVHGMLTARVAHASLQQRFPSVSWG
ncbi:hypothetical protein ACS0TY_034224 [Phlomoides rotata]